MDLHPLPILLSFFLCLVLFHLEGLSLHNALVISVSRLGLQTLGFLFLITPCLFPLEHSLQFVVVNLIVYYVVAYLFKLIVYYPPLHFNVPGLSL